MTTTLNGEKSEQIRKWVRDIVGLVAILVSVLVFFGAMDRRITVVETKQEQKIDRAELLQKLNELENRLLNAITESKK